ncbi:glycerate kinase [Marisediminicola senii]|uniref:glycerate kinase n=1 Tax=Marisediminicola senii TaxID=2711233 RepID=UPI0013EB6624|nr:glycerate kinase [Marisediminicola senii]
MTGEPTTTAPLSVVIAPDSFKNSASATDVAAAIATGWRERRPADTIAMLPQADGGEGTLDAIQAATPGSRRHAVPGITGPDGAQVDGQWLELSGGIAVVELADSSGLPLMRELDALGATTTGLGETIRAALDAGARSLVVCLGGSASTDGGAGALAALGLRLARADGSAVLPGGAALATLDLVDTSDLLPAPVDGVTLITDVTAPLLGPTGAAAVFGPQKGADASAVATLDDALARFADILGGDPGQPGAGAAGGTAFGFAAVWPARIVAGSAYLAELTGLPQRLATADVLICGEGRFDDTSLGGKVVGHLITLADDSGARVGVIAGQVAAHPNTPSGDPIWTASLVDIAGSVPAAMADPLAALVEAGRRAAEHFGPQPA